MLSELEISLGKEHTVIKDVLCSFAKTDPLEDKNHEYRLKGNLDKLRKIYECSSFRHKYSKIFLIISSIDKTSEMSVDNLTYSMEKALEYVSSKNDCDENFKKNFLKLYDHVVLEILQINYMREIEKKSELAIKKLEESEIIAKNASKNAKNASKKLENMQREYITILGIFASIVFAFVAGLTFSTSVLSNIDKASIYRLSFIVCLIGLFITNILHYLYSFIREIHFSKIAYTQEEQTGCDLSLKAIKNRFCNSYIFKFNLFITCIMITIFIFWRFFDLSTNNLHTNTKIQQNIKEINRTIDTNNTTKPNNIKQ